MRVLRVFARPCGLHGAVVEDVDLQEDGVVVVHARPRAGERGRCGRCGRCSPGYDRGEGRRRWRALDPGTIRAYLGAEAPRVRCRTHGVTVARVPWCPSRCLAHARLRGSGGLAGHPGPQERHHPAPARLLARGGRGSSRGWWPTAGRGWPIPWMAFAGSASTRSRIAAASATSWASSATTAGDTHRLSNARMEAANATIRHHAPRLRLPLRPGPDRAGDAHPRRALPAASRSSAHVTDPRSDRSAPIGRPNLLRLPLLVALGGTLALGRRSPSRASAPG